MNFLRFPDHMMCLNSIDQAWKGWLICLSRIDQAEKAAWFAWAEFLILLKKLGYQANYLIFLKVYVRRMIVYTALTIRQVPDRSGSFLINNRQLPDWSGHCLINNRQLPGWSGHCLINNRQLPNWSGSHHGKIKQLTDWSDIWKILFLTQYL